MSAYQPGAASLFAVIARTMGDTETEEAPVPCPHCNGNLTQLVDHEHDIYFCIECNKYFTDLSARPATAVDRSGPSLAG
jgi:hypothetical protein